MTLAKDRPEGEATPGPASSSDPSQGSGRGGAESLGPEISLGTVYETAGGRYGVTLEGGEQVTAVLRGRLKQDRTREDGNVVVGDRVRLALSSDGMYTIEERLPRTTAFQRRGPGGRQAKIVAANLDLLLVVMAARDPEPREALVDRFLVAGEANGVETALVLNKVDLPQARERAQELEAFYRKVGYQVILTSGKTGEGLRDLRELMEGRWTALVGPSGAGKSSLLNALQPGLDLRVGAVSLRKGTGKHTTVQGRLLELPGGIRVADTPGFSDMALWGVEPARLGDCFPEFRTAAPLCRFRGCFHTHEPGCQVKERVESQEISILRFESYRTMLEEAEELSARGLRRRRDPLPRE